MRWAYFIDTSVMDNILNIPDKNERHEETMVELSRLVE